MSPSLKIVVTGASGALGINFLLLASDAGLRVEGLYNRRLIAVPGVKCVRLDLTDHDAVRTYVRNSRPDWIVHCAAETDVDNCERNPLRAHLVNAEATRNLAVAASAASARLLYVSSDSVFDGTRGDYLETDATGPVNEYAKSKLAGELATLSQSDRFLVVRTNIYGWRVQGATNLPNWLLARLDRPGELPGFRDVFFTPILVNDLSTILLAMMANDLSGIYHVGGGETCSKADFVRCMTRLFGYDAGRVKAVSVADIDLAAPRPRNTSLNCDRIVRALGITLPDLETGLRRFRDLRDMHFVDRLNAAGRV